MGSKCSQDYQVYIIMEKIQFTKRRFNIGLQVYQVYTSGEKIECVYQFTWFTSKNIITIILQERFTGSLGLLLLKRKIGLIELIYPQFTEFTWFTLYNQLFDKLCQISLLVHQVYSCIQEKLIIALYLIYIKEQVITLLQLAYTYKI